MGTHWRKSVVIITWLIILFYFLPLSYASHSHSFCHYKMCGDELISYHPVFILTGGTATARVGQSQVFPIIDSSSYNFAINKAFTTELLGGGYAGMEFDFHPDWYLQTGLSYYQVSAFTSRGLLTQGADPQSSDQYLFRYRVNSRRVLIDERLLYNNCHQYHPYIAFAFGVAFNKAYGYQVDYPPFLTFSPLFSSNRTTAFTYRLGFGIDVDTLANLRLGIGYRFSDLGKVSLGSGHIDTVKIGSTLTQSHLYTQELVAQLTYMIT